jgi:Ca2+-binding EF-hand superfamily protein
MDQDCDGVLSKAELMKVAKLYNLDIEEKDVDLMIEMGDQHGEGGINYEEFSKILRIL